MHNASTGISNTNFEKKKKKNENGKDTWLVLEVRVSSFDGALG